MLSGNEQTRDLQRKFGTVSQVFIDTTAIAFLTAIVISLVLLGYSPADPASQVHLNSSADVKFNQSLPNAASAPLSFSLKGVDSIWWPKAQDYLVKRQLDLVWQEKTRLPGKSAAWFAPSRRSPNFSSFFTDTGLQIVAAAAPGMQEPAWSYGMHFIPASVNANANGSKPATIQVKNNRIEYQYASVTEWYVNRREGIEHGVTLHTAPALDQQYLNLQFALNGNNNALADTDGHIVIRSAQGNKVLDYGKLKVTDATGKSLPARLTLALQTITINVDTSAAVYPIEVDPLLTDPNFQDACQGNAVWCFDGIQTGVVDLNGVTLQAGNSQLGWSVANAGDVNGDGIDDIIVGDPFYSNPTVVAATGTDYGLGRAYLYYGALAGPSEVPAAIITPPADRIGMLDYQMFGISVASAGDVNKDGYADIIIGSPGYSIFASNGTTMLTESTGAVYIYFGGKNGPVTNGTVTEGVRTVPLVNQYNWIIVGTQKWEDVGYSAANAGDVNGDGFTDVIIGLADHDYTAPDATVFENSGAAYVYYGPLTGSVTTPTIAGQPDWSVVGHVAGSRFGRIVASAGDINRGNGTAYDDVIITAPRYSITDALGVVFGSSGRAYVFYGSANGLPTANDPNNENSVKPDWWAGQRLDASFGYAADGVGDINADGNDDIVIGARNDTYTQTSQGAAYVYLGSAVGLKTTPQMTLAPGVAHDGFGDWVAGVGDVNDDGYADIGIGSPYYTNENVTNVDETKEGAVYLYLGSQFGIPPSPERIIEGGVKNKGTGSGVAGGDFNHDGYSDVLIGGDFVPGRIMMLQGAGNSDLSVSVTDKSAITIGSTTILPGNRLNYAFSITNYGPDPAHGVTFNVILPPTTLAGSIDISSFPPAWSCAVVGNTGTTVNEIRCPSTLKNDIANISIAAVGALSIPVSFATSYGVISTRLMATGTNIVDPDPNNNQASVSNTVNTPPQGVALQLTGSEDPLTPLSGKVSVVDPDVGDNYSIAMTSGPNQGQLTLASNGSFSYQPNLNWFGTDSFSYQVTDALGDIGKATVSITITAVNDRPSANAYSFSVGAGATYVADGISNPRLVAGDIETATAALVFASSTSTLASGSTVLMNSNGVFTFTVPAGSPLPATESFTYNVTDNDPATPLTSLPATITVNYLVPGNAPPVAYAPIPNPHTTLEDTPLQGNLATSDDQGVTAIIIDSPPLHGSISVLTGVSGAFSYQPNPNFSGTDQLSFHAVDAAGLTSNIVQYLIVVTAVNDAPVANDVSFTVTEDSGAINNPAQALLGSDIDNNGLALTYAIGTGVNGPALGSATLVGGSGGVGGNALQYVPYPNVNGVDTFTYSVTDNAGAVASANVSVTISAVNDAPTLPVNPLLVSSLEDAAVSINLVANDTDVGQGLSFSIVTPPTHGTGNFTGASYLYQATNNYNGQDTFTYRVTDNGSPAATVTGTVNLQIVAVNDPPTAAPVSVSMSEDGPTLAINLSGNDVDLVDVGSNETITYSISTSNSGKANLTLVNNRTGSIEYIANPNANGLDSFNYTVTDAAGITASTSVNVNIRSVNDKPYFSAIPTQTVFYNAESEIRLGDFAKDVDLPGDSLTFSPPVTTASLGTVALKPGAGINAQGIYLYTAPQDPLQTTDSFVVRVNDGLVDSDPVTVNLTIIKQQKEPVASDSSISATEDQSIAGRMSATDIDGQGDIDRYVIVTGPAHGLLANLNSQTGSFVYTPTQDYFGPDQFTYQAVDKLNLSSNIATMSIAVQNVNDPPVVVAAISEGFNEDGGDITVSATDIDNDVLTFELDAAFQALLGSVSITSTSSKGAIFHYTPIGRFGLDVFSYHVTDNSNPVPGVANGRVFVSVTKDGAAPPTPAELVYPEDQSETPGDEVDVEWSRSTVRGQHTNDLVYHVEYCDHAEFSNCTSGNNIEVPKAVSDLQTLAQASSLILGSSGVGWLAFGLLGSASRRNRLRQGCILLLIAVVLAACSDAAEKVTDPLRTTQPSSIKNVQFKLQGLQQGTEYYWRVTSVDTSTGSATSSNIHRFTTQTQ